MSCDKLSWLLFT